jgi:hypothetical protein
MILSANMTHQSWLIVRRDKACAAAAQAARDHGLLFHFKIFIDVFAVNPQLARSSAIAAGLAREYTRFF